MIQLLWKLNKPLFYYPLTLQGEAVHIQYKLRLPYFYSAGWTLKRKSPSKNESTKPKPAKTPKGKQKGKDSTPPEKEAQKDNSFRQFRSLCAALSDTDSYNGKTALVCEFFTKGTDGCEYRNLCLCTLSLIVAEDMDDKVQIPVTF
jgi:hypothetical protein